MVLKEDVWYQHFQAWLYMHNTIHSQEASQADSSVKSQSEPPVDWMVRHIERMVYNFLFIYLLRNLLITQDNIAQKARAFSQIA